MSFFRTYCLEAIHADLKKNEYKTLLFLLVKTLGYGKTSDNLTSKTIAKGTGVRLDHSKTAVDGLVDAGFFDAIESYDFENLFSIPPAFLKDTAFFTPSIRKSERPSQNEEAPPQTREDLTEIRGHTSLTTTSLTSPSLTPTTPTTQAVCSEDIVLPKQIGAKNRGACVKHLLPLSAEQRDDVIRAYEQKERSGVIKSPAGFLIYLAKMAAQGTLVVDDIPPASQPCQPSHPSHKAFDQQESQQDPYERASQLAWLHDIAGQEGITLKQAAQRFNLAHVLTPIRSKMMV